jgi:hypothetical protein
MATNVLDPSPCVFEFERIDHLLYRLIRKTHTRKNGPRMGFFICGKAPTGPL